MNTVSSEAQEAYKEMPLEQLQEAYTQLLAEKKALETYVLRSEERRRAFIHILSDLNTVNHKLNDQRKAMIHILADYEQDRSRLAKQTERLDNSRRALMHILLDSQQSNLRLENSRKAMIHIMSDLKETTAEVQRREQELREKQEQLVQAGKLATLGELTTGVAHELNNPLNNIGLFVGNAIDLIELVQHPLTDQWNGKIADGLSPLATPPDASHANRTHPNTPRDFAPGMADTDSERILQELHSAMQQVRKATEIISHLRTFGRAASVSRELVAINQVVTRAISLMREQLRLRQIEVELQFPPEDIMVIGNAIQLEQVFINLLANARDALADSPRKVITITGMLEERIVDVTVYDSGPGIAAGLERRIFDPFFTTKEVGAGTGLGLSIIYGIIKEHQGTIAVENRPGAGASFSIQLPLYMDEV